MKGEEILIAQKVFIDKCSYSSDIIIKEQTRRG
jgi:hypothetical protein